MKFMSPVLAVIALCLVFASTVLHTSILFLMALLKWLLPLQGVRKFLSLMLIKIAESV